MEKSKLTAYALNEVSETERTEIETYLNSHPEEKAFVEEVKLVSSILKTEMAADLVIKAPGLEAKRVSFWSSLLRPRVLATGFGFVVVGVISAVLITQNFGKQFPQKILVEDKSATHKEIIDGRMESKTSSPSMNIGATNGAVKKKVDVAFSEGTESNAVPSMDMAAGAAPSLAMQDSVLAERKAYFPQGQPPMEPESNVIENPNSGEEYKSGAENDFILVSKESLSTFSIDVDTASYSNARRYLTNYHQIPPADSIRTEEFVNYFDYDYKAPTSGHPIAVHMEATKSPWNPDRAIIRVGLKAKELDVKDRPKSNLVFLIDVSGSMEDENKLPLVKSALITLTEQLDGNDRISIVVYAGQSGVILDSTAGDKKDKILSAIQNLSAGGGTNGEGGIRKAYEIAQKNYVSGGNNRVILASDGDFNVGVTSPTELLNIIKEKSEGGVFLTVLGFGMGNYKDARLEEIANKGQGNYFYIDNSKEANKVFVSQLSGTLYTMAKDVKVQVEFNPKVVHSYRLVGYENRMLQKQDFNNDKVDAGEMGAGHSMTALYEIEWKGKADEIKLKYQSNEPEKEAPGSTDEILTAKVRYKKPKNSSSEYFEQALKNKVATLNETSCSTKFAMAVASFSQWMRQSVHLKDFDSKKIIELGEGCLSTKSEKDSFKQEFVDLVKKAREIKGSK